MNALASIPTHETNSANDSVVLDVVAARSGDLDAYTRLVHRHRHLVSSIALAIARDLAASQDVAQEVFIATWRDLSTLRDADRFVAWLRETTRNHARMYARRNARFARRNGEWDLQALTVPTPTAAADQQLVAAEESAFSM